MMRIIKTALWTSAALLGLALVVAAPATADQVILDDLIVDGSACIGFDCVNGESFGFDTIRIKENNLRIRAQDTSSTASFPSNDWQITFNDSANGGANKFSIDDIDGGRTPFTIEAGAPSHSLYVDDGGRLGLGTNTPVVDVHIKSGNTPTLRLEQDGSSGFTPQTWDVAGNEANFFIRDATNGSTLPFRIQPGAPSNAVYIEATTGDVGFGTTTPDAEHHIRQTVAENTTLLIENTNPSNTELRLLNSAADWNFRNNTPGDFVIFETLAGSGFQLTLESGGNLEIQGMLTTSGTCSAGLCDGVFHPDLYEVPSIEEHASYMWANSHLKGVGPTPEEGPVNISQKVGGILNELEHAHIYIEHLHKQLKAMEARLQALEGTPDQK